MQTSHNGRIYELTASDAVLPSLRADLLSRGWEGVTYYGFSRATGQQRKNFCALFYRNAKTGEFIKAA